MAHTFTSDSVATTERAGVLLAGLLRAGDVIALAGDLGAGKTQLVRGVAAGLGVSEPVTSPTFNLLLVHPGPLPLYHIDLYRLERESDLDDIGFYEVLEGDGVAMVEWGDRFPAALPPDHLLVTIHRAGTHSRHFDVRGCGQRGGALARLWYDALSAEGMLA